MLKDTLNNKIQESWISYLWLAMHGPVDQNAHLVKKTLLKWLNTDLSRCTARSISMLVYQFWLHLF